MAINEYIRDLLLFNERVIFPGLGTLEIRKKPAKISGASISPPSSDLVFDPGLKRDDGLLSARIAQAEETGVTGAQDTVLEYIDSIIFAFNKGESFEIEGVCTLFQDADNNVRVTKSPDLNLDLDSFGLETLDLEPLSPVEEQEIPVVAGGDAEKTRTEPGEGPGPESTGNSGQPGTLGEKEEEEFVAEGAGIPPLRNEPDEYHYESGGNNNRNTLWILSGAIVVVLTALVIMTLKTNLLTGTFDFSHIFGSPDTTLDIDDDFSNIPDSEFEFDNMVNELENEIDSSTAMENAMNVPEPVNTPAEKPQAGYNEYHIIAGSFRDREHAVQLQQNLTMRGMQSMVIERGDGYYRVSAATFKDKATAIARLNELRELKGMKNAWVMRLH